LGAKFTRADAKKIGKQPTVDKGGIESDNEIPAKGRHPPGLSVLSGEMTISMRIGPLCLTIALLVNGLPGTALAQSLHKSSDTILDPRALAFTDGKWGTCINGQSFQQDALTGFRGWQYATWYDADRHLCVGRTKNDAAEWQVIRFDDYRFEGNDTHNVAVIGLCPANGTIHLAFDHHGDPLHYRVSEPGIALSPETVKWTADLFGPITSDLEAGSPLKRVTYPRFVRTPNGRLQLSYRVGGSGDGDKCLADYNPTNASWHSLGAYASGRGKYLNGDSRNAYLNGLTYDTLGRLHATWCWRETGNPMTNHDLCYAYSNDLGMTWLDGAGRKIGERGAEPFTVETPGIRAVEFPMHRGLINATTQAVDSQNRIHLATFHLPEGVPEQPTWEASRHKSKFFHYWRDKSGAWERTMIDAIGSRPQLWFDGDDNAYLIFCGDRYHPAPDLSIWTASAKSVWSDWRLLHAEKGRFFGQPQVDRHAPGNMLSVYVQEEPISGATHSPLRVINFLAK
jgi:hypothetical protein